MLLPLQGTDQFCPFQGVIVQKKSRKITTQGPSNESLSRSCPSIQSLLQITCTKEFLPVYSLVIHSTRRPIQQANCLSLWTTARFPSHQEKQSSVLFPIQPWTGLSLLLLTLLSMPDICGRCNRAEPIVSTASQQPSPLQCGARLPHCRILVK